MSKEKMTRADLISVKSALSEIWEALYEAGKAVGRAVLTLGMFPVYLLLLLWLPQEDPELKARRAANRKAWLDADI